MKNNALKTNSIKFNYSYIFFIIFFILYQILSSVFIYLPILYGLFFCYMIYLIDEKEKTLYKFDFRWYFILFYLVFIDITHNYFIFSSWLAFFIFYYMCADWIKINLKIGKFIPVCFVICAYIFIYIVDFTFSYSENEDIKIFGFEYFLSMIIESILSYIFFKDKF